MTSSGEVTSDELRATGVEADLLEHPSYIGVEHVELAPLRLLEGLLSESSC
jgi:hypothetical protein